LENPKENPQYADLLVGDAKLGADDAAVMPGRLDRYSKAHHRALAMSDYAMKMADASTSPTSGATYSKMALKLRNCGNYLLFRDYYTVGKVRLHAASFCKKHLLCPFCAIRRGAKMVKAYMQKLAVIKAENPDLKAYLVTLTVKDGPDLSERFNHLYRSIQKLHKARGRERQYNESCKAAGAVWSYEFKRGKNSGDWHPHVHAVWLCNEAPDAVQLSAEWKRITGDSFIVDVTPFHDQDDVINGFLEVFKYAVKFSDLPLADNWHGFEKLAGKRLIASFGVFRGVDIPDDLTDEPLDDLPYVDMLYKFIFGAGYSLTPMNQLPWAKALKRPRGQVPVVRSKDSFHLKHLQRKFPKKE
jgi:Replication protein